MESTELCRDCRAPLQLGSKFCAACGHAIDSTPVERERRQLTLLFCDVVGSTALSERLDPEDLRDLLTSYQRVCRDAVGRYQGHISQFLGDGVMSYFGYPIAHEDDAVRAISAGLRILEGIKFVNDGIGKRLGADLHVRVGLHTGVVVVGDVGPGGAHDRLAIGETVNLAARIAAFTDPDTVLISASTERLVHGHFELQSLSAQILRGFTRPVELFRVVRPTGARTKFEAAARGKLTSHVGRGKELSELASTWKQVVEEGKDRVVVVRGEAGIGKSRIVHQFRQGALDDGALVLECFCSPLAQATALAPIVEMMSASVVVRAGGKTTSQAKLEALGSMLGEHSRFGADVLPLMAALLSIPGADEEPVRELSPVRRRARTLEILRAWIGSLAERMPVALLVEDVHWADPSTLDFLDLVVRDTPGGRTLLCVTARPEFVARWSRPEIQTIELSRLSGGEVEAMITSVAGGRLLPSLVATRIAERSEGVPLFVEEVTKAVLESGALRLDADRYELTRASDEPFLPPTVHGSLVARFDRLAESRRVAQLGAAIGREFDYPLMHAVADMTEEELREHLDRIGRSEIAFVQGEPPKSVYIFKHALIQDAIYATLIKSERARVHERIFKALVEQFPELVAARPEIAAYHAENAGKREQAVPLLRDAGLKALGGTAVVEAVKHLARGIELVDSLHEPGRTSMELDLQAVIGPAYMATVGWASPEVERSAMRLRELAADRGDGARLLQAMWGLWTVHFMRGKLNPALEVANQVYQLAQATPGALISVAGHNAVGYTQMYRGAYTETVRHAEAGLALFEFELEKRIAPLFGAAPSVGMWNYGAMAQWMLGFPEKATQWLRNAGKNMTDLGHPPTRAYGLCAQFRVLRWMDRLGQVRENAIEARALAAAEGFELWVPMADIHIAWADARQGGDAAAAADKIRSSISVVQAANNFIFVGEDATMLCETLLLAGKPKEALAVAERVFVVTAEGAQHHCEPELYRLQGEAALALGEPERAAEYFRCGVRSARSMEARSLELRCALSLHRLIGGTDELTELRTIFGSFTEGFDEPDLKEAAERIKPRAASDPVSPARLA
jgi:class 3 adenylate cyclase